MYSSKVFFDPYLDDAATETKLQTFINNLKAEFRITSESTSFILGLEINRY